MSTSTIRSATGKVLRETTGEELEYASIEHRYDVKFPAPDFDCGITIDQMASIIYLNDLTYFGSETVDLGDPEVAVNLYYLDANGEKYSFTLQRGSM